ncbi:RimK family alpha-L-glutamate ligase [Texcoconibacillus texcoconensis]|uniref:RimK family alpha-L-glutamate ligase n=1 Tax=Texcoconibacillus texcoconensis TaxID=1095777 RepID=A0A840QSR2_9BACI|nr:RimK family alpha-L-glutamate ligase [Texcoconibacillus texcoconensis]MBB5174404.1 RimK family alpha-L-glutamate ligase [Texcoconibacillus texcoconensis]
MARLTGWVIYNGNLKTEKFLDYGRWIQQAAKSYNIDIHLVANHHILTTIDHNGTRSWEMTTAYPIPDFVHMADKDVALARTLQQANIPVFNQAEAIDLCDHKGKMHEALAKAGLPVPKTILAPNVFSGIPIIETSAYEHIAEQLGYPLIMKEAYGSFGQQVYRITDHQTLLEVVKQTAGKDILFQESIETSYGRDIRLNVIGGKVVAAMARTSKADFRANVTAGGATEPYEPNEQEHTLAIKAAEAVNADFAGVDLLFGPNGPILCEINSNPHIRSIYECTGTDVANPMLEHIIQQLEDPS